MKIYINNLQRSISIDKHRITKIAQYILRLLNKRQDLSVAFVDDKRIAKLNAKFRGENRPTDVLAFGMYKANLLGDVVISTDAAKRQAPMYNSTIDEEITLYLLHGILHLAGFNDEKPKDRKKMEAKQEKIFKTLISANL